MLQPSAVWRRPERRGVVLLVVLALLTLFAVVGLAFVLYADSEATSSRIYREALAQGDADVPAATLLNYFLGQLIYDLPDDDTGVYSGLRGHGLARLVYGYDDDDPTSNAQAFNGTGRLHYPGPLRNTDDYNYVNYTYFPSDSFLRDPERLGYRAGLSSPRGPYTGGANGSYTYPDVNNMFLAAVQADGTVLCPSFHRPWLFNPGTGLNDTSNPNWTNALGKYLLLRPRPAEMGQGFPYPSDPGGDVKNLVGAPGGNDSVWMDLGFPVLTMGDGRKFKPLFAPLIMDLDNRVNVNAHGNVRGRDASGQYAHASNQGWGPWEVSLQQVLGAGGQEWANLFVGASGRYGSAGKPGVAPNNTATGFPAPHFYGQADYDGCNELTGYLPSGRASPPDASLPRTTFPTYNGGYGNGSDSELQDHPVLFNVFSPGPGQRTFTAGDLGQLLQAGNTRGAVAGGTLASLCPTAFSDPRTRRLVTTHSFDHRAAGSVPWMYDPTSPGNQVQLVSPDQAPSWPPMSFPPLSLRGQPAPGGGEFRGDWRGGAGPEKLDVNRPLPPYPHQRTGLLPPYGPAPVGTYDRFDTPQAADQYFDALFERQRLADDIYRRLLAVTAVPPPFDAAHPSDVELALRRWLAQLAVNIVDYIDDDDISTPFNFYTAEDAGFPAGSPLFNPGDTNGDPELPKYWVFGVELPRLVVNEALVTYQVPSMGTSGNVNLWVELHNPFQKPPDGSGLQPQDGLPVPLKIPGLGSNPSANPNGSPAAVVPYQVVVANQLLSRPMNDNVLGKPDTVRRQTSVDVTSFDDFPDLAPTVAGPPQPAQPGLPPNVPYVDIQSGTSAFFLLGPPPPETLPPGPVPPATTLVQSPNLQYPVTYSGSTPTPDDRTNGVSVLLRRLVNPHIPYDWRPTVAASDGTVWPNPWYNPYLTIDHIDQVPLQNAASPPYASTGKLQPYAAHASQVVPQNGTAPVSHTFGQPNDPAPATRHYDWLVHLDRQVVNPMELLQVAGCQPYQLTQRFITGTTADKRFTHVAPWFDQSRRLYRLFEFLDTTDRVGWQDGGAGDRVPGRVNLNTVWDPETLMALADPQGSNAFTPADVTAVFNQLMASRSPAGAPGPGDRPFRSLATGVVPPGDAQYPSGSGIQDTMLRSVGGQLLFQPAVAGGVAADDQSRHPYLQDQLLTKLFGNVTTRSNVFAVWLTVGFFQVTDDSTRPVRLGPELGLADGRLIRHRMFAIVDRSVIGCNARPVPGFDFRNDPAVLFVGVGQ